VINSINLIDGIDGLASGLTSIAMIIYGVTFVDRGEYIYAMIAFASLGVLVDSIGESVPSYRCNQFHRDG
jgi:UDP-N-acetylmuramyl pentapeptide phosphotransferase/UDP-N-acetylglucosamine-1-phosphate transferase